MNQCLKILLSSICLANQVLLAQTYTPPRAKITVEVVDEARIPVPGATVELRFCDPRTGLDDAKFGTSDHDGLFTAQGYSHSGPLGTEVSKEGYYICGAETPFFRDTEDGKWQPWNPTCIAILRKVQKPSPVYAKRTWIDVPASNSPCGYDLMAADWVAPWGKGTVADFVFTVRYGYTNILKNGMWMDLTFSNPSDGIQLTQLPKEYAHCWFMWPNLAPEVGYESSWHAATEGTKALHTKELLAQKFYFRVRTVVKDGKIVSGLYGKMSEGFWLAKDPKKPCGIHLCYYLNPTSMDRNMEFDLSKNFFKSALTPREERVWAP